ncbi:hypothetical protein JX580_04060 [Thiomicrospira microaerophila]|uniref:TadE/TadG family type IV pilus assembly protein n=1 Tax=Thiomicrospira microaerophila TaxID=406020 RepID=UPI00200BF31C|nr:hypothetical protein [Thiomicrospira microaerophila]UQB43064.1 hypothetical protein JX580_04060 [Thiomicrospira microaerophila]
MQRFKQSGAVSIEAALVMPLMALLLIASVEVVSYSADRLLANQILLDVVQSARHQGLQVARDSDLDDTQFTVCQNNRVMLKEAELLAYVQTRLSATPQFVNADAVVFDVESFQEESLIGYVVKLSFPSSALIVPGFIDDVFPITANNILTFDLPCH